MAALNQLRAQLVAQILSALEGVDASEIRIPLGRLVASALVWARGPEVSFPYDAPKRRRWSGPV